MTRLALAAVSLYQALARPLLPRACRFHPSCSDFLKEAITARGLVRGLLLGARRLLACHPFSEGGFDPVCRHG